MKFNKKGESGEQFATKSIIFWILIVATIIIIVFIVKGIINKLLVLY